MASVGNFRSIKQTQTFQAEITGWTLKVSQKLDECVLPVFAATLSRRKWPLDKYSKPKLCAILLDIVPFPDPGGPMITARNSLAIFVETGIQLFKNLWNAQLLLLGASFLFLIKLFKVLPGENYPRFGCALSSLCKCLSNGVSVTPTLCWNKNAFTNFPPSFKLYYGYTLSCVFKDRLSSANQWGTGCNALFCSAHPEKMRMTAHAR